MKGHDEFKPLSHVSNLKKITVKHGGRFEAALQPLKWLRQ